LSESTQWPITDIYVERINTMANHRHICWAHQHNGQSHTYMLNVSTQWSITDMYSMLAICVTL